MVLLRYLYSGIEFELICLIETNFDVCDFGGLVLQPLVKKAIKNTKKIMEFFMVFEFYPYLNKKIYFMGLNFCNT